MDDDDPAASGVFAPASLARPGPATLSREGSPGDWRDDADFVANLRASWEAQYAEYLGTAEARRLLDSLARDGTLYDHHAPATLVAWRDGRRVGLAALRPMGEALSLITALEVIPAYRGRGIGAQLLRTLETGARHLMAHVSIHRPRVRAWYVSSGFSPLPQATVEHGAHSLVFDVVARSCTTTQGATTTQ